MVRYLLDTSVWIDYLRNSDAQNASNIVQDAVTIEADTGIFFGVYISAF